jgi:hypothetical protein
VATACEQQKDGDRVSNGLEEMQRQRERRPGVQQTHPSGPKTSPVVEQAPVKPAPAPASSSEASEDGGGQTRAARDVGGQGEGHGETVRDAGVRARRRTEAGHEDQCYPLTKAVNPTAKVGVPVGRTARDPGQMGAAALSHQGVGRR